MTTQNERALNDAWQIHAQLAEWTGRADLKARFALSFATAILALLLAIYGDGTRIFGSKDHLEDFSRLELSFFVFGAALLLSAAVISTLAINPQLRSRDGKDKHQTGLIYFGHLRHWEADDLAASLRRADILPMLAQQHVSMSKILWRKHCSIRWSLRFAIWGFNLVLLAEILAMIRA